MNPLPYRLDRIVMIQAAPDLVFRFFTESDRWARWWGTGSTIDAVPGGRVLIRHANGVEVSGEVVDVAAPARIVFTYGYGGGTPIPPGGSVVTIRLEAHEGGTRLHLSHEFAEAAPRDEHVQGWRFQLSLFGNLVADEVNVGSESRVDTWFHAWSDPDARTRERLLGDVAAPDVRFRDRFSLIDGLAELLPHIAAAQRFMPGIRLHREGDVRHCQGTLLADWVAVAADRRNCGSGTNVFLVDARGKFTSVTGLWRG
jgi:uncharacterized protein YndB with AHSA1/START domain